MKGKVVNTILLLVVAAIWGYIGYSIYHAFGDEDETSYSPIIFQESVADSSQQIFSINPQYQDPFLKGFPYQAKLSTSSETPIPQRIQSKNQDIPTFDSERIQFTGVVSGSDKRMKAIVSLDNQNYLVGDGQVIGEIEVVKVMQDSIQVKSRNYEFWISKKKIEISY